MAIVVAYNEQSPALLDALVRHQFAVTEINALGGFLHEGMTTFIVGTSQLRLTALFSLLREHCPVKTRFVRVGVELPSYQDTEAIEVRVGGATVFVVPVDRFEQI
jgi:uncharacterized protein YaaQ